MIARPASVALGGCNAAANEPDALSAAWRVQVAEFEIVESQIILHCTGGGKGGGGKAK
ncbi:MAG TPA: hypothetical protein VMJ32_18510 [Pirellulales bacterium]|nr:hypothetical protein [Pirellulales bacterium]